MRMAVFADVSKNVINCDFRNVIYIKKTFDGINLKQLI